MKNNENDLELFKKEVTKSKDGRRRKVTDIEEEDENQKYKRNKEMLEKHMKDNSFKMNSSTTRIELAERITKLNEIKKKSQLLTLKVSHFYYKYFWF